ncbi:MAG: extracellular solute-binding protein [Acidimicrobiales bacterium]|jgi:sn-glycerol 3-phosphate transport system substrate-binding protein|nr:extracellular solute-binding protein [Acidimicrobiales bacterium]
MSRRAGNWLLALLMSTALTAASCGGGDASDGTTGDTAAGRSLPPCPLEALDAAEEPVEVVVWHSLQAKQDDTLVELADEYNASQDKVRVRMENQAATDEELLRTFTAAVPSRQLPGLFVANDTMTQLLIDSDVVLPAQSCVDASGYDLRPFAPTVLAYYTVDGVLWAGSANPGSALVYYNKDHFREAGLDPEQPPRTLDELRTMAEQIRAAGVTETPFVHEVASYKTEFWLTGARAPIVDNDNGRSAPATRATLSDNPAALELFEWFAGMEADGLLLPVPVAEGQINQYLAMATEQASIIVESSSASTSVEAFLVGDLDASEAGLGSDVEQVGFDVGAGAFPGIDEPGRTQMGGPAWYIMSTTPPEVQAAAWDFLTFMNAEHAQTRMLTGGSFLPFRTSAADTPEAREFFASSLAGSWLEVANEQVGTIDPTFPGPLIGPYDRTRDTLRDALTRVVLEGQDPRASLDQAQQEVDDALGAYAAGGF